MHPESDHINEPLPVVPGLEVLDVVARGGHGTVYMARQENHDRLVALKVLDARFVDDTMRRRFDRERVALGRLSDHPSIVSLLDSGYTEAGAPYLLLEYAPGGSLADRLVEGPLNLDEATSLIISLAGAIERSHAAGIVHRDIKPGNVLRSAYGDWMLSDFGIASIVDRSATSSIEVSYAHTAPETFNGEGATPVADVYSLASLMATALTGREPFEMQPDEAPVAVMRRVLTEPYPDLRRSGVPDDLAVLLEMALSKEPIERPVSARAFAMAVNMVRVVHGLPERPIRIGDEANEGATVGVDSMELPQPRPSWSNDADDHDTVDHGSSPRRGRLLAFVASFFLSLFVLSVAIPVLTGDGLGDSAIAAVVEDVIDAVDDDGPGNGDDNDNDGNNGPGNGNNNDNDGDGPGGDDDDDDDGPDNDGPGNGNGNGPGNGNNNGPGNGPRGGGGNGGNGNGGNGPGNGGGGGGGN